MNNSTEIISLAKDIFKRCIQHFFKILSMPLRLIFYTRIGERQLTANIIPYWLGIALLLTAGFLDGSVLYPSWYPTLPFIWCLTLISISMWFFQYWQIQYFHTTNPKKVWPSNSIGVPRFFFESGPIPQRWTQPLLLLGIGSLYYLLSESTSVFFYFIAAAFGLWADYTLILGKQHSLYLDEMDAGLSAGEIPDSSLEVVSKAPSEPTDAPSVPVTLDNRAAFLKSLRRAQGLFGHVPGDAATEAKTTSSPQS